MTLHFFTYSDVTAGTSRQRAFRVADALNVHGLNAVVHHPPILLISGTPVAQEILTHCGNYPCIVYSQKRRHRLSAKDYFKQILLHHYSGVLVLLPQKDDF